MKNPNHWTKEDLHQHLQHAVDLEFWTIPLYLTAAYSVQGLKQLEPKNYPKAAKLVLSVVIQEMLHLEIACNLCNALGYSPQFNAPKYEGAIPFIHPKKESVPAHLQGFTVALGPLDENRLKLFCAIELPEAPTTIHWENQQSYHSIGELYTALREGITHLWDTCYVGDAANTKQKGVFSEYASKGNHHGFSQTVNSLATALNAIEAIVEQGEGANAATVSPEFRPPAEGTKFDTGWYEGELSHYQKFSILLHHQQHLPEVYPVIEHNNSTAAQAALQQSYASLLNDLTASFNADGPKMSDGFWNHMFGLGNAIIAVWEAGACPKF